MVNWQVKMNAIVRLIRGPNLFIIAATQILMRQCIMTPLLDGANMVVQIQPFLFWMIVVSTVLIAAGGYAINDYFDRKIDQINKPGSMVVGIQVNPRQAMATHLILTITGVIIGTIAAIGLHQAYLSLIFFIVSGLLWFYSTTYKRELLLGNIIIALLTALVPFIVLLFEIPLLIREYGSPVKEITEYMTLWVAGFSIFAFLLNLVREIVKDAQDYEGDRTYGKKTIPVTFGTRAVRYISVILISGIIILLFLSWNRFIQGTVTLLYFGLMIAAPLVYAMYILLKDDSELTFRKVNQLLKIVMIFGLGYSVMVNLIFKNIIK